jgi:hypothetical protein
MVGTGNMGELNNSCYQGNLNFSFFGGVGFELRALALARQTLYTLSHSTSPFL